MFRYAVFYSTVFHFKFENYWKLQNVVHENFQLIWSLMIAIHELDTLDTHVHTCIHI